MVARAFFVNGSVGTRWGKSKAVVAAISLSKYLGASGKGFQRLVKDWRSLRDMIPNLDSAQEDFVDVVRLFRLAGRNRRDPVLDGKDGMVPFRQELVEDELGRARYARHAHLAPKWRKFGKTWGTAFTLWERSIPLELRGRVDRLMESLSIHRIVSENRLVTALSSLGTIAKKYGDMLFDGFWKYLVDLETFGGFHPPVPMEDFTGEISDWVTGDVIHTMPPDDRPGEDRFLDVLEEGVVEFLSDLPSLGVANEEMVSISEFAENPHYWARSGASTARDVVLGTKGDGAEVKARKNKWSTALAWSSDKVRSILEGKGGLKQRNVAIQKRETKKVRAVVNSDVETYIRMSYVSLWLERALEGSLKSTLYMSAKQQVDMWLRLADSLDGEGVRIPLDQSHFDWQQNLRMIGRFVDAVELVVSRYCSRHKDDILSVLRLLRVTLTGGGGTVRVGKNLVSISKGIMSGWKWTALMDTAFNWGELHCARTMVKDVVGMDISSAVVQGDDDQVTVPSYGVGCVLVEAYRYMNFELNLKKFFMDTERDEFLRQVVTKTGVSGYPARIIPSIMFRNPVSRDEPRGILRLNGLIDSWSLLFGRGGVSYRAMLSDLSGASKLSIAQVESLMRTPATLGGLGVSREDGSWLGYSEGRTVSDIVIQPQSVKGLTGYVSKSKLLGKPLQLSEILTSVEGSLDFGSPGKVVYGEVFDVERVNPYYYRASQTDWSWRARSRRGLGLLVRPLLNKALDDRDYEWIHSEWVDGAQQGFSRMLEKRGGRRVWKGWLKSEFPTHPPKLLGLSPEWVSIVYNRYLSGHLARVFSKGRFGWTAVVRACLSAEYQTHEMVHTNVLLGG